MKANAPKRITTNAALLLDAIGCFGGAALLLLVPRVWDWTDLPDAWRQPVIVALFLFAAFLVIAARYRAHRAMIALAVAGNLIWMVAGACALFRSNTAVGIAIIAAVIVLDATMAWLQSKGLQNQSESGML